CKLHDIWGGGDEGCQPFFQALYTGSLGPNGEDQKHPKEHCQKHELRTRARSYHGSSCGRHKPSPSKFKTYSVTLGSEFCSPTPDSSHRRSFVVPRPSFLKCGRCSKNGRICEASAHDLKTHGQPLASETAGNRSGRLTCNIPRIAERRPIGKRDQ